jgi:N-hydroxyarylamine O-acetyltransferase
LIAGFDLDAYLARIGYAGERSPSIETLTAIHLLHTETIPFENLDPFLKRPVNLAVESLQRKLVQGGRGGYCFEHNLLLSHALGALGFHVTGLAARVMWGALDDRVGPRSHMLLLINVDGERYVADVGFGGQTLTTPLRLETDVEQKTSHEPFRLVHGNGETYAMQSKIGDVWKPLYRFDLQEQFPADYEVTNWYLSHHPDSRFVTGLIAARVFPDGRYGLLGNQLTVHRISGETERRTLSNAGEMRAVLKENFGITLAQIPELDAGLERLGLRAG